MKRDELKVELAKRGLSNKGLKPELQERLRKAMVDRVPVLKETNVESPTQRGIFVDGTRWELLKPKDKLLVDPYADIFREPTMSKELADLAFEGVEKRDYKDKFERPEFTGTYYVPKKKKRFNKQVYDRETQKRVIFE